VRARLAIPLAVAVLTAAGLGGCGASDDSQVRDTLAKLARATAHKDYKTLCRKVFAHVLVQRVTSIGLPCERAMSIGLDNVRRPRLKVLSVHVEGGQADAQVRSSARGEKSSVDTVHLIKENGEWRVSSLITPQAPH
jgi:hypothetical protein